MCGRSGDEAERLHYRHAAGSRISVRDVVSTRRLRPASDIKCPKRGLFWSAGAVTVETVTATLRKPGSHSQITS